MEHSDLSISGRDILHGCGIGLVTNKQISPNPNHILREGMYHIYVDRCTSSKELGQFLHVYIYKKLI